MPHRATKEVALKSARAGSSKRIFMVISRNLRWSRRLTTWRGISLQSPGATAASSLKVLSDNASQCCALFDVNQKPCNLHRAASTGASLHAPGWTDHLDAVIYGENDAIK